MPKLTLFVREDSYFVAVSQKLCNICIMIYINHKRHITENNDGYVPFAVLYSYINNVARFL